MHSTSVYGLELLVMEGTGGKALATDNRDLSKVRKQETAAKFPPKFCAPQQNVAFAMISIVAFSENGELQLKLLFLVII